MGEQSQKRYRGKRVGKDDRVVKPGKAREPGGNSRAGTRRAQRLNESLDALLKRLLAAIESEELEEQLKSRPSIVLREREGDRVCVLVLAVSIDWLKKTSRLSPCQKECVRLAATGMHNKQIAEKLGRKEATVAAHLRNAFAKLGVSSRNELAPCGLLLS